MSSMADPSSPDSTRDPPADPLVKQYRSATTSAPQRVPEIGGRKDGTDPTRYGDWEKNGRCIDF
jgi:hypothetical protein